MKDEQIAERKRVEDMADCAIKNAQKNYKGLASDKDAAVLFAVRAAMWSLYCMTKSEARRAGFDACKEQALRAVSTLERYSTELERAHAAIRALEPKTPTAPSAKPISSPPDLDSDEDAFS